MTGSWRTGSWERRGTFNSCKLQFVADLRFRIHVWKEVEGAPENIWIPDRIGQDDLESLNAQPWLIGLAALFPRLLGPYGFQGSL